MIGTLNDYSAPFCAVVVVDEPWVTRIIVVPLCHDAEDY